MRLNFIIDYLYKKAFALTRDKIVKEMERKQIDRNYLSDFLEVLKCSKQHTHNRLNSLWWILQVFVFLFDVETQTVINILKENVKFR